MQETSFCQLLLFCVVWDIYLIMLELALAKNIHLRLKLKNGIMKMLFMSFQKGQQSTWTEMVTFFVTFSLDKSRWIKDGNVSLINLFFPKNATLVKTFIKVNFIFWTQFDRRFWMEIAKNFKIFAWKLVKIEFSQFF